MESIPKEAYEALLVIATAMFGSVAHVFSDKNPPRRKKMAAAMSKSLVVSAFSGYTAFLMAKIMHLGFYETSFLGCMAGWMGGAFIEWAINQVKRRF